MVGEPCTLSLTVCCNGSHHNKSAENKAYSSHVADGKITIASGNERVSESTDNGYVDIQCDMYETLRIETAGSEYNMIGIATSDKQSSDTDYANLRIC